MAVIEGDFDPEIIRKFRGVLDYYYYRGRLVVRSWPRKPILPRSPNVQSTAQDFADTARALSSLPLVLQDITREVVAGTSWTWRDAWTTALYGHNIEFGESYTPPPPGTDEPVQIIRLATSNASGSQVNNVNSTTYIRATSMLDLWVDYDLTPFTKFRIILQGLSNAGGQTISLQLARRASPATAISASGNDLVIPNTSAVHDSGWIDIATTLTGFESLCLAAKGSNATVDLTLFNCEIHLYTPPA